MKKNVLIIGAGIGGLVTALRLAKKGFNVHIIEKNEQAGGRLNQIKKDGFTFDTGPSFFSMSYEFKKFAEDCNIELPFKYFELDPLYCVNFSNNPKNYFLYKDIKKLAGQFLDAEPDFEKKINKYLTKSGKLFDDTINLVIKKNYDSLLSYILTLARFNPVHLPILFRNFWQQVSAYFSSDEARQIISLVSFFLGRTPFDTMAIYSLLSYTEFVHDGYYNVEGGMYRIIEGLVNELKKENVKLTYNTEIVSYSGSEGKLEFFIDKENNKWYSDIFLVNSDAAFFRNAVFNRKKYNTQVLNKMNWTMGYLTFYLGIKCKLPQVNHHNYFLGSNYEDYSNNLMQNPKVLQKPYYYVNMLSKHNPNCAPDGCESLFFVCPVPNLIYKPNWDDREVIVNNIITDFSMRIKKDIVPEIISKTIYTPVEWGEKFNLYQGSGLGLSHNFMQIGYFRPPNYDEVFKNVFYTGSSTHPGAGLPIAIINTKLAFERIMKYSVKNG